MGVFWKFGNGEGKILGGAEQDRDSREKFVPVQIGNLPKSRNHVHMLSEQEER